MLDVSQDRLARRSRSCLAGIAARTSVEQQLSGITRPDHPCRDLRSRLSPPHLRRGVLLDASSLRYEMSGQTIHNIPALNLTTAEAVLWKNLQGSRMAGKKFRRQHSVGKYVLDFYCPECQLAVELDGEAHFTSIRAEYDVAREEFIKSLKIRTVRFENRLVFENLEGVLETIKERLK